MIYVLDARIITLVLSSGKASMKLLWRQLSKRELCCVFDRCIEKFSAQLDCLNCGISWDQLPDVVVDVKHSKAYLIHQHTNIAVNELVGLLSRVKYLPANQYLLWKEVRSRSLFLYDMVRYYDFL